MSDHLDINLNKIEKIDVYCDFKQLKSHINTCILFSAISHSLYHTGNVSFANKHFLYVNTPVCKIKLSDRGKSPTVSRDDTSARTLEGEESDFDRGEICSKQLSSLSSSSQTVISGPHKMSCELS